MSFSAVAITAGSGTNVAVDTVASNNYQRVKLVDGTADGTGAIGGDATNGLDVDVTRVSGTVTVANGGTFAVQAVCTNAGTFAVQAAQSGTWNITNVSGTISLPTGAATAAKQPALGTAGTASSDVITVQGIAAMTPLLMQLSGTNTLTTVTTVGTVTTITNVVHVDDNSGSLTVDAPVGTPVFVRLSDGASAITTLPVSLASVPSHAVTNAGTFAVQAASAGDVAHDAVDSGNPVKVGGIAQLAAITAVADADRVNFVGDSQGRQVVAPHGVRDLIKTQTTTIAASTSETTVVTAVASHFMDLLQVVIANTSATAARVDFRDTTAGSVIFSLYAPAGATVGFTAAAPLSQTSVNTNWTAQSSASITDLRILMVTRKTK